MDVHDTTTPPVITNLENQIDKLKSR
jgi:hypothetical protein